MIIGREFLPPLFFGGHMSSGFIGKQKGFTLIELLIVIVIIGVLAALAIPRYMQASTKSKQAEAYQLLKQFYTMESTYRHQHETYWGPCGTTASAAVPNGFMPIGVEIMASSLYTYTICLADPTHFTITATSSILDDDPAVDTWQIDQDGNIVCTSNDVVL